MMARHRVMPLVIALALACAAAALTARQARDARPASGTASISGRVVVSGTAKQPARRVRVTLTDVTHVVPGRTTTTGDDGVFLFRDVPAGRFELQAFKNGYLRASYGASSPDRGGTPIVVRDGESVADLVLAIARGGVIAGAVRDARGRPVPGATVRVLKQGYHAVTGEPTLVEPASSTVSPTDDRGEYRAFGLPPGGYLVVVTDSPVWERVGMGASDAIRQLTAEDVRSALEAARSGPTAAAAPAGSAAATRRMNYAPVFHPGATDVAAAATVVVGVSEERTGVDIVMQLVPTAAVSGRVTSLGGPIPPSLSVFLVPAGPRAEMLAGAGLRGTSTRPGPDGAYTINGVAPGVYTIRAMVGRGRGAPVDVPSLSASADIVVNGEDLDVPLTLQPGVAIDGRIVFEGTRPDAAVLQTLSFALIPPGAGGAALSTGGGRVDAEGRFSFASVPPGEYRFIAKWNAPAARERWTIRSATANGREAFESPLRVNPNEAIEWTIAYTDRPARLSGVLRDRAGRPAPEYDVLVFSSDRRHWTPGSRRIQTTRPATDGAFSVAGLPAGEYFLAALTALEPGEWNDPALLEQLVSSSMRVVLRDGETTTQDLQIAR